MTDTKQIIPLGDRVLVTLSEHPNIIRQRRGETGGCHPMIGTIAAVGPDVTDGRGLEPGQVVTFGLYAGGEFHLNGQHYVVLREDELIAIPIGFPGDAQ